MIFLIKYDLIHIIFETLLERRKRMDIKTLQYFIAVVESTSITKAAKMLHISQPPLSQQLKQLEQSLGTRLFERGPRHITLTSAGEMLYHRAKNIVDFMDETCREIQNIGSGSSGHIRIGMISSFSPNLLSKIMHQFHTQYPKVQFDIYERNTYELIESLDNNLIELALVRTPFDENNDYNKILLGREPLVAFGKQSYFSDITSETIEADFFHNKPIVIYRRWKYILDEYFKENGITPLYSCINDDAKSSLLLALSEEVIAVVPEDITHIIDQSNMDYRPILASHLATDVYAVWNPNRYLSPAAHNFIQVLDSFQID